MIRLSVENKAYEGWITVEVERSLDDLAHRFSLRYLDRWGSEPWPIRMGAACTLYWDADVLITGYVNRARFRADSDAWTLSAEGRSLTGDLVDSSATHKTGAWANKTATQIARDLCEPFDIAVTGVDDGKVYPRFALEQGESVHDAIDRLCKVRALLPITRPTGQLQIVQIGDGAVTPLDLSQAIARELREDDSERHSHYLVRATGVGSIAEAFVKAEVVDEGVKRWRPLVVIGDAPMGSSGANTRAAWERDVRAGRSERVTYTMLGVNTSEPGALFSIADPVLGVNERLVLTRAVIRSSSEELVTEMEFARPEAFQTLGYPNKLLSGATKTGKPILKKTARGGGRAAQRRR